MIRQYGELIVKALGQVLDVEVEEDDMGWGVYLRLQVEIHLSKPLSRGRNIRVKGYKI